MLVGVKPGKANPRTSFKQKPFIHAQPRNSCLEAAWEGLAPRVAPGHRAGCGAPFSTISPGNIQGKYSSRSIQFLMGKADSGTGAAHHSWELWDPSLGTAATSPPGDARGHGEGTGSPLHLFCLQLPEREKYPWKGTPQGDPELFQTRFRNTNARGKREFVPVPAEHQHGTSTSTSNGTGIGTRTSTRINIRTRTTTSTTSRSSTSTRTNSSIRSSSSTSCRTSPSPSPAPWPQLALDVGATAVPIPLPPVCHWLLGAARFPSLPLPRSWRRGSQHIPPSQPPALPALCGCTERRFWAPIAVCCRVLYNN
ncbi:uncharacterized protein LOC118698691 [Molothrus ater]|uniref:uncharacterized protein LOC118698691 n=1 Tax=Molothrus ater TaxID=84834 RepID=UPI00174B5F58|nr:uncharacterized protein LOC118698691 [Molothrus ater]